MRQSLNSKKKWIWDWFRHRFFFRKIFLHLFKRWKEGHRKIRNTQKHYCWLKQSRKLLLRMWITNHCWNDVWRFVWKSQIILKILLLSKESTIWTISLATFFGRSSVFRVVLLSFLRALKSFSDWCRRSVPLWTFRFGSKASF